MDMDKEAEVVGGVDRYNIGLVKVGIRGRARRNSLLKVY